MSFLDFFNFKYDKNWLKEWNRFLSVDLKEIPGDASRVKLNSLKPACYEAYELATQQKKFTSLKDVSKRTLKIFETYNLPELLIFLSRKAGNIDVPEIRQTIKGLLRIRIMLLLSEPEKVYQKLGRLSLQGIENEPEFLRILFRETAEREFLHKLFALLDVVTNLSTEIQEELQAEWLPVIRQANHFESDPQVKLFPSDEDILTFIRIRSLQKRIFKEQVIATQDYADVLWKDFETLPDSQSLFLSYLYCLSLQPEPPEIEKNIIGDFLRRISVSRELLLKIILLYRQTNAENTFVNFPLFLNILRNYLEKHSLDESLYHLLTPLFPRATLSKYRQLNDLLMAHQKDLQATSLYKVFPYLHTGIFLRYENALLEYNQLTHIQKEIVLIQSQVITTETAGIMHKRLKVKIDGKIVSAKNINSTLQKKGVPYQWVSFYRKNEEAEYPVFIHSLLLNRQEYALLDAFLNTHPEYVRTYILGYPEYIDEYQTNFPLINDLKILQKISVNAVGDKVFINDIRWKNIKTNIVDKFPEHKIWYEIMNHIIGYTGSVKPSKTWLEKLKKLVDKLSPEIFELGMNRLLYDVSKNPFWYQKSQVKALRGMIWASTLINPYDAVMYLEKIMLKSYERPRGSGQPRSLSGGSSTMAALIKIDSYESYRVLKCNYLNSHYERFVKLLNKAIDEFEKQTRLSVEKLQEIDCD